MLKNYKKDHNGIVFQVRRSEFCYDSDYSETYTNMYKETPMMSHLRLGFLLGALAPELPKKILDVGYGNGDFIHTCSNIIEQCYGYDIPPAYPLKEGAQPVDNIYDDSYDVVCFFDSLEHFPNIYDIKKIKAQYIFISLPWCHYFDDEWFENWKHRKPDEHLWHFDLNALIKFMDEIGFDYITHSPVEDVIRISSEPHSNILSAIFKKK